MSEAAKTLEGWYCLHDFRTIDWTLGNCYQVMRRESAIHEY